MEKAEISYKQKPLKYICNEAYHLAAYILPDYFTSTKVRQKATAFGLGLLSGYFVADFGQDIVYILVHLRKLEFL